MKPLSFWAARYACYGVAIVPIVPLALLAQLLENQREWKWVTSFIAVLALVYLIPSLYVAHKTAYYMVFAEKLPNAAFRLARSDLWIRLAFLPIIGQWLIPREPPLVEAQSTVDGFVELDFKTTYPHVFWISGWGRDKDFSDGFRYKVLSIRHEPAGDLEVVLVLETHGGHKSEMKRWSVAPERFDGGKELIRLMEQDLDVKFERMDMSAIRSFDELEAHARQIGWEVS